MIYEVFLLIVPFCVTPYVSRTLGAASSGQYSYVLSIVTYFVQLSTLGFDKYAQRLVAFHQDKCEDQKRDFWEILICKAASSFLCFVIYVLFIYSGFLNDKYLVLSLILSMNILSVGIDIAFFFQGNENFKTLMFRNILIKSIGFCAIFYFVKDEKSVNIYAAIQSIIILGSNISLWWYIPKSFYNIHFNELDFPRHFKPAFLLFIPTMAVSVYTCLDKTLIGLITQDDAENGYYEYSEKLVKMALIVITALGTVMIPRNSKLLANNNFEELNKNISLAIKFVFFLGLPMCLGLIAISDNLIPWYLGNEYMKAISMVKILSPIIVIIGISNVLGMQYLIPLKRDKEFTIAILIGAISNFTLNLILIPNYKSTGACISTVISELIVTIIMFFLVYKELNIKYQCSALKVWKNIVSSSIMYIVVFSFGNTLSSNFINTILLIAIGGLIYYVILLWLKDEILLKISKKLYNKFKNIFKV